MQNLLAADVSFLSSDPEQQNTTSPTVPREASQGQAGCERVRVLSRVGGCVLQGASEHLPAPQLHVSPAGRCRV